MYPFYTSKKLAFRDILLIYPVAEIIICVCLPPSLPPSLLPSVFSLNTQGVNMLPRAAKSPFPSNIISLPPTAHFIVGLEIKNQWKSDLDVKLCGGSMTKTYLFSTKRLKCIEHLDSVLTDIVYLMFGLCGRCF